MKNLDKIIAIASGASQLTGEPLIAELLNIIGVASHAYQELAGKPVDPALVPKIEEIP